MNEAKYRDGKWNGRNPINDAGDEMKRSFFDTTDGIDYELWVTKDGRGRIRVTDRDSDENIGIRTYPDYDAANAAFTGYLGKFSKFSNAYGEARDAAQEGSHFDRGHDPASYNPTIEEISHNLGRFLR